MVMIYCSLEYLLKLDAAMNDRFLWKVSRFFFVVLSKALIEEIVIDDSSLCYTSRRSGAQSSAID